MSEQAFSWLLNYGPINKNNPGYDLSVKLLENRDRVVVLGHIDNSEEYEFDMVDILSLDGEIYIASTQGCSCPSYDEVGCVYGPYSGDQAKDYFEEYNTPYYRYRIYEPSSDILGVPNE